MERGKKSYLTQKDAIFEVLYAIGGVDIYRTPESNSNLSYTIMSYAALWEWPLSRRPRSREGSIQGTQGALYKNFRKNAKRIKKVVDFSS